MEAVIKIANAIDDFQEEGVKVNVIIDTKTAFNIAWAIGIPVLLWALSKYFLSVN
jgi:hypothetical protein